MSDLRWRTALEHLVMVLDRSLTTIDPSRYESRMTGDVRHSLTLSVAALSQAGRELAARASPGTAPEREVLESISEMTGWLRRYAESLKGTNSSYRVPVTVPYLRLKSFRDGLVERELLGVASPEGAPPVAEPTPHPSPAPASRRGPAPSAPSRPAARPKRKKRS